GRAALVERVTARGLQWSTEAALLDAQPPATPGGGGVVRLGEALVAVAGRGRPTLVRLFVDGRVECRELLDEALEADDALALEAVRLDDDAGLLVIGSIAAPGSSPRPWVSRWLSLD
ncbi:MAG: hypothetical protein KDK70_07535, partial [Myxococcales bacterium]|nr:hypothetical protein [Myxococcales bacterium]